MSDDTTFTAPSPLKRCSKCGIDKPLGEFTRDAKSKDGHAWECRACRHAYNASYHAAHKEDARAKYATYYAAHRDEVKAYRAAYKASHKDNEKVYKATYHSTHKEAEKARHAAYRAAHPDEEKARSAAWHAAHPEEHREHTNRRRARKQSNGVELVSLAAVRERDKMVCHICGKKVKPEELHFDHVIPISKGGPHAEWNVRVAHAFCNMSKHGKLIGQPYLPLRS